LTCLAMYFKRVGGGEGVAVAGRGALEGARRCWCWAKSNGTGVGVGVLCTMHISQPVNWLDWTVPFRLFVPWLASVHQTLQVLWVLIVVVGRDPTLIHAFMPGVSFLLLVGKFIHFDHFQSFWTIFHPPCAICHPFGGIIHCKEDDYCCGLSVFECWYSNYCTVPW
jgi:hypothetical protein